jgi:hypothetical protein
MTSEVIERRKKLWLSWLELPWDVVRDDLIAEMHRVGMSHEDLAHELRNAGYSVTHVTVGNWLGGRSRKSPPIEGMQALVQVFAGVSVGDWSKGRLFSENALTYALGPDSGGFDDSHDARSIVMPNPEVKLFHEESLVG